MLQHILKSKYAKPVLFVVCLVPLASLIWRGFYGDLGANPIETITHNTGDWTLRFLLITLAVSPLRQWFGLSGLVRFRRMFGLYVFFYACCHFSIWFIFDHAFDFADMIEDIVERRYITVGFSALMLLIPLALTSNNAMVRRLGKRWKKLHQLSYLIILLGVLHYLWLVKADYLEPGIYALIAVVLLLQRVNLKKRLSPKTSVQSG
ncbi:MAG: sulfite oxidase heme-binding subunit YedZ [Gammaproteobacteria bacterium]